MIPIDPIPAPRAIETVRARKKPGILAAHTLANPPDRSQLSGYGVAKKPRYDHQRARCAFCDRWVAIGGQPVEHFRPALGGYFWLAWDWDNLLFACVSCNSAKSDLFPGEAGHVQLTLGQQPPQAEQPTLLNPYHEDPLPVIWFELDPVTNQWFPTGTARGRKIVKLLKLDQHIGMYQVWDSTSLRGPCDDVRKAITAGDTAAAQAAWNRLLSAYDEKSQLRGLTWCVVRTRFTDAERTAHGLAIAPPRTSAKPPSPERAAELALLATLPEAVRDDVYRLGSQANQGLWDIALLALLTVRSWNLSELAILTAKSKSTVRKHARRLALAGKASLVGDVFKP